MPAEYREDLLDWFEMRFVRDPDVKRSQMMGHPGWACVVNNKMFLMLSDDGILLKLPPERYDSMLARDNVVPFSPMGMKKGMGTWVVWTLVEAEDYEAEWAVIREAKAFVNSEPPNPKRGKKKG